MNLKKYDLPNTEKKSPKTLKNMVCNAKKKILKGTIISKLLIFLNFKWRMLIMTKNFKFMTKLNIYYIYISKRKILLFMTQRLHYS